MGLFVPVSSKVFDAMPKAASLGSPAQASRTSTSPRRPRRGILVFNIEGRNAEAVSDFAIGLIIAESRNIARAHLAIKTESGARSFPTPEWVPQLKEKKVGIVGFGYIGGWSLESSPASTSRSRPRPVRRQVRGVRVRRAPGGKGRAFSERRFHHASCPAGRGEQGHGGRARSWGL